MRDNGIENILEFNIFIVYVAFSLKFDINLCSAQLKLATTSSKLATQLLELLTRPAVTGAGSLGELALRDEITQASDY